MRTILASFLATLMTVSNNAYAQSDNENTPLVIQEQGSFATGGTITTDSLGNKFHGDHGYVFYQIPVQPRKYPIVMLHGIHQASKTWESTPDGREGFQNIFLRRNFSVYNLTHPRRGNAGRSQAFAEIAPIYDEQTWYTKWRIGVYPEYFDNVQFPRDEESLNQFMRQMTPNIGPIDFDVNTTVIAGLFDNLNGAIMMAHSAGVMHTWKTIPKSDNIKGVVALEGGGYFSFPTDGLRPETDAEEGLEYIMVSPEIFQTFTRMPMLLIYGDNIPTEHHDIYELDVWRIRLSLARQWADAVNRRGGDVTVIHLPEIGIYGNTHFPMSDLNNKEIADIISKWLHEKGLD